MRRFNKCRNYAVEYRFLGGTANGGNGGKVDNSASTVAIAAALTAYAAVEKGVAHHGSRCI